MTTSQQHTPGPWHSALGMMADDGSQRVCTCTVEIYVYADQVVGQLEHIPNSCLIAAAPDLLAACQAALQEIASWDDDISGCNPMEYPPANVWQQLRSAIAKATGSGSKEANP